MKISRSSRRRGLTLVELVIGIAFAMVVAMIAISISKTGLTLFARNTSINLAHINTRNAVDRMAQDIRQSVLQPLLTGTMTSPGTFVTGTGAGPYEGIQLVSVVGGPYLLTGNNADTATQISMTGTGSVPAFSGSGWHVIIPGWKTNRVVNSITVSGSTLTCVLTTALGNPIDASSSTAVVPVYLGLQINYYVSGSNGSLIRYDSRGISNPVVARVLTPQPFTQPDAADIYIGIHLGTTNSDYCNRAFVSSDILYNSVWVPFRGSIYNN